MVRDFKELDVWKRSMALAKVVYSLAGQLPKEELFALSNQIRRCAVSVPSNIAEGNSRAGTKEYVQFLCIARGSLSELETQVILAKDIGYLSQNDIAQPLADLLIIKKMLNSLISALRKKQ